ncbi:hypothetical protein [Microbacterium sp.]|uniref:hypothetical protein n=1 Tax=Microbacterium sp. TaxID=51671 RepID=UPI002811EB5C|nr:hypothetical protein [Microbacterium sp.]
MSDHVHEITEWLFERWLPDFPIAVVEGFAGVGKSTALRQYFKAWPGPKAMIPLVEHPLYEEFLLGVLSEIEMAGLANVSEGPDLESNIVRAVQNDGLLLVLDNFESQLDADGLVVSAELRQLLARLAAIHSGRACIVSSRSRVRTIGRRGFSIEL